MPEKRVEVGVGGVDFPTVRNDGIMIRTSGVYALSKETSLQGSYMFQRLMATHYAYLGMQFGTGTNYLPSNEKAPSYAVHAAGISVIYKF